MEKILYLCLVAGSPLLPERVVLAEYEGLVEPPGPEAAGPQGAAGPQEASTGT